MGLIDGDDDDFDDDIDERIENKKIEIISTFPIPTTKEDMIEFLALAIPKAKSNWFSADEFTKVWKAKCEQVIMKAKFSMKDDKTVLAEIMQYAKELKIK